MSSDFDWAEAKARRQAPGEVSSFDVVDWPDIAVTETELNLEDTAKLRAMVDERELAAQISGAGPR